MRQRCASPAPLVPHARHFPVVGCGPVEVQDTTPAALVLWQLQEAAVQLGWKEAVQPEER